MSALTGQPTSAGGLPSLVPIGQHAQHPPIPLLGPCFLIGAQEGVDIRIVQGGLEPVHALVVCAAQGVYIRNLAGAGTVLVNGQDAYEELLCDGDTVDVGEFTCRFQANQAVFEPPDAPPAWAFELNSVPVPPPRGRTALVGSAAACDVQLSGPEVAERHLVLFAADGRWQMRDLVSATGTFVNGRQAPYAPLSGGEILRIGLSQLRYLGAAAAQPSEPFVHRMEAPPPAPTVHAREAFLGGMPVVLPELALPQGFGHVNIMFGEKKTPPQTVRASEPAAPVADGFIAVNQGQPSAETVTAPSAEIAASALALAARVFPTVPRCKTPLRSRAAEEAEGAEEEDQFGQDEAPRLNDAPFGGAPLGGSEECSPDSPEFAELLSTETEDFSANEFWNRDDDAEVHLPERPTDLSPYIPPIGGEEPAAVGAESSPGGNGKAAHAPPEPRRVPVGAAPALAPVAMHAPGADHGAPPARRSRAQKIFQMKVMMAGCMAVAAAGVELLFPLHSKLEGRLLYENTPAADTQQWRDFEADQQSRLANPDLRQSALQSLGGEHPGTRRGFLGDDGKFAPVVQSARFDGANLVLSYAGYDRDGDTQRLAALLQAVYKSDSDVMAAASDARKAVSDWEPRVTARQAEMTDLQRRADQQKKVIAAAQGLGAQLPKLQSAAMESGRKCMAAEQAMETDLAQINLINARLASVLPALPEHPATRPTRAATRATTQAASAATKPAVSDLALEELQRQIDDCSEQLIALETSQTESDITKDRKACEAAHKQMAATLAAAESVLKNNPDMRDSLVSAGQLESRVDDVIDELVVGRQARDQLLDLQRLIAQADRRRERIIEDSDPRLQQMGEQLNTAQRRLTAAQARGEVIAAQTQPTTQQSDAASQEQADAQHGVDDVLHSMAMRQSQLYKDDNAHLRDRLERLSDDAMAQLRNQRQLVVDTLGTLQGRLAATSVPEGLADADTATLSKAMQALRDLGRSQEDYSTVLAQADPTVDSLSSVQQQLAELTARADGHRAVLSATMPRDKKERESLSATRDALLAHMPGDRQNVETARASFAADALASATAGLTVAAARKAQQALDALTETLDVKNGDIAAMEHSRDDLALALKTTVDLKPPSESNVKVVSDDSVLKHCLTVLAVVIVGAIFRVQIRRQRRGSRAGMSPA